MNNKELGEWGEKKAGRYLSDKGYQIAVVNYRCNLGEIDLIARDGDFMVFVEVKTRRSSDFGPPQAAVDYMKQQKLKKIASYYLLENDLNNIKIRFDVIAISIIDTKASLKHFINAF